MNWSRCLPSEDEVKATPQNWHTLSFGAGYLGPGVPGSDFADADSAMAYIGGEVLYI